MLLAGGEGATLVEWDTLIYQQHDQQNFTKEMDIDATLTLCK